jgi:hypothetical protein
VESAVESRPKQYVGEDSKEEEKDRVADEEDSEVQIDAAH